MPKYEVVTEQRLRATFHIDADDVQEARDIASDNMIDGEIDPIDTVENEEEIISVREI